MSFAENLRTGRATESLIAKWLMARGAAVMPAYEIELKTGKGPQVFTSAASFVAPDLLVFNDHGIQWVEAKHKTVFTWHRMSQQWTTGIDLRHYADYLRVTQQTKLSVWLLFFHDTEQPAGRDVAHGCPDTCPTGLFGGDLFNLVEHESHRTRPLDTFRKGEKGHGHSGMVYWSVNSLRKIASREDVIRMFMQDNQHAA